MKVTAVILAAGQGTRMRSDLPKVMHAVCGQPMIYYAIQAAKAASSETPVVVIGHAADAVKDYVHDSARLVFQEKQLGTGHAVLQAESFLRGKSDYVIVTYADMPLLRAETLSRLVATQGANPGPITLLTVIADDPRGFGRIIRKPDGSVEAILEEAQASPEQLTIQELNVGAYCFSADWLWEALHRIPLSPKGEYYLTDTVELAVKAGLPVQALLLDDPLEAIGINTRIHLSEAEVAMRQRINSAHMLAGVTLINPQMTYIEAGVTIGLDTVIWPNSYLQGGTRIGENCEIGPDSILRDTVTGQNCVVLASVLEGAILEDNVDVGPFAHLRKGAHLCSGVHMGNFGEVKDSTLGPGTKMGHFSYIGNATIGPNVNIGAGTITCNYDGVHKHPTQIGADVFIGSDTMLVAPVELGDRSRTGAGSVVTKNVPEDTLVVGMPARAISRKTKR
ncbi:MAG: bifunctional UDP-N-acetylglucosamine diphosphorylase/glucosamine-1-phosphate N-acetyltransferase GlmU [Anaerolineales bacterium]|nr:bifunctional UDP-N-acetylglucosamine diphosphorylase/glucosamine-1-phosphate N-acetyltransferase GlmU [Anaerolineales bacterium]